MKLSLLDHRRFLLAACCLLATLAPPPARASETKETRQQTIQRCRQELASDDAAARRRAVLLLAVYANYPEVTPLLLNCLQDDDPPVRRSALVSLKNAEVFPDNARPHIFKLLLDPDLEVRRTASSMLGHATGIRMAGQLILSGNVRLKSGKPITQEPWGAEALANVIRALHDQDPVVRRNVLTNCQQFAIPLPQQEIRNFLHDAEESVRIVAVNLYQDLQAPEHEKARDLLQVLASDTSTRVRQQICLQARNLGAAGLPLLKQALQDQAADVRFLALMTLAQQGQETVYPLLQQTLLDENTPLVQRSQLIRCLANYLPASLPLLEKLAVHEAPSLATPSLRLLAQNAALYPQPDLFLKFLDSPQRDLVSTAMMGLRFRLKTLTPDHWQTLLDAKSTEAKRFAILSGLAQLDDDAREQALLNACLDHDLDIRRLALQRLATHRPTDWLDILLASLEDESPLIRQTAAEQLTRFPTAAVQKALANYLPHCTNQRLAGTIRRAIARKPLPDSFLKPAPQKPNP